MTNIIDGKKVALKIRDELALEVSKLRENGITPGLAVVLVGTNPASEVYVRMKKKACQKAGIESYSHELPSNIQQDKLLSLIDNLNNDPKVHGILVQLPLSKHLNESIVINHILPEKDVDGFHPISIGKLLLGEKCFRPCTPAGIMELIDSIGIDPKGKQAVVVGRSNIVGKPVSFMLLERHATLTICHSRTKDLPAEVKRADILIAAIGKANFIKGDWIKEGAVVIDVGMNRTSDGKLVGDVEFETAKDRAGAITPVPGGVGPMTIAMLLKNTVEAAKI
ncbi:MAG: bifunctional methylenetetrahydrofolate dehydrogenase/methenyltetrahydrofolate cyclohydrolase FolD [Deltaproteobacteria bacterium]|jgi:methylenetetrahydrofolate dehydrogenase (NADP+) / methenyltetrahydrofolate cyclohydrolase|nr:bifunctional methylenetetrahydrofolate dehydrogenase/methenyltetrahydrofolate cyclohydrolase FolD [Deltaproteobacteria bacterium]